MRHSQRIILFSAACCVLLAHSLLAGEVKPRVEPVEAKPFRVAIPEKPIKLPEGDSRPGWEAFVKNDFETAERLFNDVLKNKANDLFALEGLRGIYLQTGRYKDAQQTNLRMVAACGNDPICGVFVTRTLDTMAFTESRQAALDTFSKTIETASPAVATLLKDQQSSVYARLMRFDESRGVLKNLGYVDRWLLIAGPFGRKDRNNAVDRSYPPERGLKFDGYTDEGEPVKIHRDVKVDDRDVELDDLFPGARGVFYLVTNLHSDVEQDVIFALNPPHPYRAYLRGMPILAEPEEQAKRRQGGEIISVKLLKGDNPLLIKQTGIASVAVRVISPDFAALSNVRVAPLDDAALAAHRISSLRGQLYGQKTEGSIAAAFLKRFELKDKKDASLEDLVGSGKLNLAEAAWLDVALQRESDAASRAALARTLAGSFKDSAGVLDLSASMLRGAGSALGNTESREIEEGRSMREHALSLVPTSHQHLISLFHFFKDRKLPEQAFELIKRAVKAHPQSPLIQAAYSEWLQQKGFYVDALKASETAAQMDDVYLDSYIRLLDEHGSRVKARELRAQLLEKKLVYPFARFEEALQRGDYAVSRTILSEIEKSFPEQRDEIAQRNVRLLLESGETQQAFDAQKKYLEALPKEAGTRRGATLALSELALRLKKDDEAIRLLEDWIKDRPTDSAVVAQLRAMRDASGARWWEPYDIAVKDVDTSRLNNERYPDANHAWVVDFMVTRVLPDYSTESYVHIAQKVLNLQGINELSELLVRAQKQNMVFVRTINPDGSVFEPENAHDFNLAQSASLYKVGPGSVLQHAYVMRETAEKDRPQLTMGFNFNAFDAPRNVSRWVVLVPDTLKDKIHIRRVRPELIEEKILPGPAGTTVYQWTNKQIEGLKVEPLAAREQDREIIPLITLETDPAPFRAAGWLLRRDKEDLPAAAAADALRITAPHMLPKQDDAAKFDAILKWVRDNILPGNDARTLSDVWTTRTGRSDQMAELAREMAQSLGLMVRSAYVNASYQPGREWRSKNAVRQWEPAELAGFGGGGQMLVLEQPTGADIWAQFAGRAPRFYSPYAIQANQSGSLALVLGDDGLRLKRVSGEAVGETPAVQRTDIALDHAGNGRATGALLLHGLTGGNFREALQDPRQQSQIRDFVIRQSWPKAHVIDFRITNEDKLDQPLVFAYVCDVKGLAAPAGKAFFLTPFRSRPRILDLRGPSEREHDMLIREEYAELDQTVSFRLPEGHGWVEVPEDLFLVSEFGIYIVDFNVIGRTLTCTRSYMLPQQRIAPGKYPQFMEFLTQIHNHTQQRIAYGALHAPGFTEKPRQVFSAGYACSGDEPSKPEKP